MNKVLYHKQTGLLHPWPAGTADHVVGLDPMYEELEVIQDAEPSYDPATHHLKASQTINLEDRTVYNGFTVEENIPLPAREATPLQVRAFLIRQSISLAAIPALIASQTAEGAAREEALMRWEYALSFPKDYPLVVAAAAALNLDLDQAWDSILAIE